MTEPSAGRSVIGKVLVVSAVAMLVLAAIIWNGLLGFDPDTRGFVAGVMAVAGVLDGLLGVYFIISNPA